jgi:hypothetical protein
MKSIASPCAGVLLLAAFVVAGAAEPGKYQAPEGFSGKHWGDPFSAFDGLGGDPFSMGAAWTRGKVTDSTFNCVISIPTLPSATEQQAAASFGGQSQSNAADSCNLTSSSRQERVEGRGFHVLVEHRNEKQGFRFGSDGVLFYPVLYQFCAHWDSLKKEEPPNFKELEKFCGMRLMFKGETAQELAALPADAKTHFDQVLDSLIARFGRPYRFEKRGRVVIEDMEGSSGGEERRYQTLRWCPPYDRNLATSCTASIVLAYDPEKRWGYVLYSTPEVWEYAYARENGGYKGEYLYRMLNASAVPAEKSAQPAARLSSTRGEK